ncbi:iduronate 2-sulfatase [Prosthecobacter fusiformis]|uniref:Iduronate 2-sulfatase n=1 Tax=Prosthecobacter fusiformis TaxID=48464 RepID=A0A4R7SSU9_9BACT|nr:sulfatase [Prosthecobacter fusiformis]TDU81288.1 iduronate 2-sulfatase [Prosthecobacter fusiformis]
MHLRLTFLLILAAATAHAAKPNVLMICVDDLKPTIGCFGDPVAKTPNIDRLAKRGVLFEKAFCNQAVCSPSRNALMTSLRPQTLGIYELSTNFRKAAPDAITMTQHFMAQGYKTEGLGKILHVGHGNTEDAASWSVPPWKPKAKTYVNNESTEVTRPSRTGSDRGWATESAETSDDTYGDGQVALEAVKRLQAAAQKPEQPFFLAVGFIRPHLPFVSPKKYWDLYDPAKLPMPQVTEAPAGAPAYAGQQGGELRQYSDMPTQGPIDGTMTRRLIHGYYAATSYMDAQLGLVLDALDANGLTENTIIVFWGDHGWHLGDHGMWCKHTNYEQAARIPVIVCAPGAPTAVKTSALIETVDIYPTLSDLAGLSAPQALEGKSFASVVKDPTQKARDSVIHVYPRNDLLGRAIRTDRYRFVEWKKAGSSEAPDATELYDYQEDPLETKNLASERPEVVKELAAILATHPEAKPQIKGAGGKGSPKKKKKKK